MKMNFDNFQKQTWITQTLRVKKLDENNDFICLVFVFPSEAWVMVLKLPKLVHFLQICAALSKKSESNKTTYLYPSEIPHHALSENDMFYKGRSNNAQDIEG